MGQIVHVPVCSCMLLDFYCWFRLAQQKVDPSVLMLYAKINKSSFLGSKQSKRCFVERFY